MNGAHWHLVVNHLPIIFPGLAAILMITGFISKSEAVKRTAYMVFIFGAIACIAAMTSGEEAEEIVEKLPMLTENYIESHEETAETFSILSYILGAISVIGLWASLKQKSFSKIVSIVTLVFAVVVLYFAKQTGTTGGEIIHTEIRTGNTIPAADTTNSEQEENE